MSNLLNIEPLGGVNEYGRNCFYIYESCSDIKASIKSKNQYQDHLNYKRVLLDCGIHKGSLNIPDLHKIDDVTLLDYVFLSHGHIDHYGAIHELYNMGYDKSVFMTRDTAKQIKGYLLKNKIKVTILEDVYDPLKWHNLDDELAILWGRNSHVQGAIWIALNIRGKLVFYSGDFSGELSEEVSKEVSKDIFEGVSTEISDMNSADMSGTVSKNLNKGRYLLPHDNPIEVLKNYNIDKGIIDCGSGHLDKKYSDILNLLKDEVKEALKNKGNILFASNIYGKGTEVFLTFLMELDDVEFVITKDFFEGIKSIINCLSNDDKKIVDKALENIFVIEAWHIFDDIDGQEKLHCIESKDKLYWYRGDESNYIIDGKYNSYISDKERVYFISNLNGYSGLEYNLFNNLKDDNNSKVIFLNKQPKNSVGMDLLLRNDEFNAEIKSVNIKAHQSINEAKAMAEKMNIKESIFFHFK